MPQNNYYFCDTCYRQVVIPTFLKSVQSKGEVRIQCNYCKDGSVIIAATTSSTAQVVGQAT